MKKILIFVLMCLLLFQISSLSESAVFGTGIVYVRPSGGTLHLRSARTTESESLGIVHHGDKIRVLDLGDEWSYIFSYRVGMNGYIKKKYIADFVPDENVFNSITFTDVSDSSDTYAIPGEFLLDLDGDNTLDTVNVTLHYDEYGNEYMRLIFTSSFGSSGEATIPFSSYASTIAFLKPDDSSTVYVFVTGDECSSDFATYGFYLENGHMKNVSFFPPEPFEPGIGMAGRMDRIENGEVHIEPVLDVLGTRFYDITMSLNSNALTYTGDGTYQYIYDLFDPELWQYASLKTKAEIPAVIGDNPAKLPPETELLVTWVNVSDQKIGFITKDMTSGYFVYDENTDEGWGINVGGIFESDAFYSIPYAG